MTQAYRDAREHLDDAFGLVHGLVERQIVAHWELGILPRIKDEFSGTFVSDSEIDALMKGGRPPSEAGREKLAALDQALVTRAQAIEDRLDASRAAGQIMPFDRLRRAFGLTATEQRVLWVLLTLEVDAHVRSLMRYLVNEANRVHADIGLLQLLVYSGPNTRYGLIRETTEDAPLFHYRLVEYIGTRRQVEDAPLLNKPVRVNRRVLELVHGIVRLDREVAPLAELLPTPPSWDRMIGVDAHKHRLLELLRPALDAPAATGQDARPVPAVVLVGTSGVGRKSLVYGAARALECAALRVECARLPTDTDTLERIARALLREAILFRAVPVLEDVHLLAADPGAGRIDRMSTFDRVALTPFAGPVAATCARTDARPVAIARGMVMIDISVPSEADRSHLWQRALGPQIALDPAHAAARYPIAGGIIAQAAQSAKALAASRGDGSPVTDRDVHAGVRTTLDVKLATLGLRITWRQTWSDLVLPEDSLEEIHEFIARVKHKKRVYDDWGFADKVAKGLGLSALFSGPPGTGKTMVAGLIADELALDLYQIDLSRIVSKYVGETEKNLSNLFDAAEAGHAILLFDEADSLFAKRTEVKSSVDRYANLEVNYLLQRMEAFQGITILTTNMDAAIDDAFRRRISFRVNFPFPEPEERERLWQSMLPEKVDIAGDIDFDHLSDKYEFSGGYIRNAVLRAAFLAANEDSAVTMSHLVRAANLEYAAMGKVISSKGW